MNALGNPVGTTGGVQREQTMEEILASIRKIIESNEAINNPVDDDAREPDTHHYSAENKGHTAPSAHHMIAPEAQQGFAQAPIQTPAVQTSASKPTSFEVPAAPQIAPHVEEHSEPPVYQSPASNLQAELARLMSQSPERRVAAAFDELNTAFMRSKQMPLEGVAEAMLQPMLQDWLDNNLPNLVERLVREEIARIARGDI